MGLEGSERNINWRRLDDGSRAGFADLVQHESILVGNGDVLRFMPDDIHSVRNEGDTPSLSLHVYGRSLARVARLEFDPIAKVQRLCPQRVRAR
jgi:predicted metal-dependent enzyme (double-stranded beta helix superfamily)